MSSIKIAHYLVQHRDRIFVNGYGFLSFAKFISKDISKNISKYLSDTYSQNRLDHVKHPATDAVKPV